MSRHEGVSCDSCLKGNFRGRRYKCLICYDYDLCAACYEAGATNTRHTTDHPMQCILTRADYELYYGGEALTSVELPQSYTCPYCAKMGYTEATLQEHVSADHAETSFEVVCPVCAAMPGGDPNLMTDDFAGHLTLEHRSGSRDLISFLDEPIGSRHNVRRIPHTGHSTTHIGRGATTLRPRRSNMHFSVFSSGGLSSLSPSSRESVDPIAELLSQLSGVRRSASNTSNSTPSQLQQLQMQLQLERQQVNVARQQLERYPRRQTSISQTSVREPHASSASSTSTLMLNSSPVLVQPTTNSSAATPSSQFLLASLLEEMSLQNSSDQVRQECTQFVQQLILSSLMYPLKTKKNSLDFSASLSEPNFALKFTGMMDSNNPSLAREETNSRTKVKKPTRLVNVVLRGRARSDNFNAKRRADANKAGTDGKGINPKEKDKEVKDRDVKDISSSDD